MYINICIFYLYSMLYIRLHPLYVDGRASLNSRMLAKLWVSNIMNLHIRMLFLLPMHPSLDF